MDLQKILYYLPEVKKPTEKKLSFNVKLKWTLIVLAAFFILANISLYGLAENSLQRFEYLAIILGTDFGSIISLGIGPIVMASIIVQLLVGSGIIKIDTKTPEGKRYFQGLQKIGVLFFILFESLVYVLMGGLQANPGMQWIVVIQLVLGGLTIVYMDEITTKWGFGSGVSLFIVAGVAWRLFNGLFQFIDQTGAICSLTDPQGVPCAGNILVFISSFIKGTPKDALSAIVTIAVTAVIFLAVAWTQSLKVEVPLSYEKLRGYGMKWPLAFFYASNMPVILTGALEANIQLFGGLLQTWGHPILGHFVNGRATDGFAFWFSYSNWASSLVNNGTITGMQFAQGISHIAVYMIVSAVFAVFWVKTSGMDESSQAKNILSSGLQIPGFRKDPRVLESILKRYILPLTIMGGLAVGALAAFANLLGALTSGTAILLAVMIMYQLYTNIAQQHALDMHPALRKVMS